MLLTDTCYIHEWKVQIIKIHTCHDKELWAMGNQQRSFSLVSLCILFTHNQFHRWRQAILFQSHLSPLPPAPPSNWFHLPDWILLLNLFFTSLFHPKNPFLHLVSLQLPTVQSFSWTSQINFLEELTALTPHLPLSLISNLACLWSTKPELLLISFLPNPTSRLYLPGLLFIIWHGTQFIISPTSMFLLP